MGYEFSEVHGPLGISQLSHFEHQFSVQTNLSINNLVRVNTDH
jgi:hypothetical protein